MPIKPLPSFLTRAKPPLDPLRLPCLTSKGLQSASGSTAPPRGLTLISRGVMRHRSFNLAGIAETDRLGALQAQLAAWQPMPDAVYLVSWQGEVAQAFAVDAQGLADAGVKAAAWLPETLAREAGTDGVRLVKTLDGVEGQSWKGGVLQASRWWPERPALAEWQQFLRQAHWSGPPPERVPEAEALAWMRPGRLPVLSEQLGQSRQGSERWLVTVLLLLMLGLSAMTARILWDSHDARRRAQLGLADMRDQVAPVLNAREKALQAADQSAALVSQLQAPQALELMAELLRLLPKDALIRELDLDGLDLRLVLELPPDSQRGKLVAELESGGWFTAVRELKDGVSRSGLGLQMKLSGPRPPQRSNADAGLSKLTTEASAKPVSAGGPAIPGSQP